LPPESRPDVGLDALGRGCRTSLSFSVANSAKRAELQRAEHHERLLVTTAVEHGGSRRIVNSAMSPSFLAILWQTKPTPASSVSCTDAVRRLRPYSVILASDARLEGRMIAS
jgi:hypothetical protein